MSAARQRMRPPPMSTGWGKPPLRIFLQIVERLRMPVRRSTSWQVISSVFDMTDSSSFKVLSLAPHSPPEWRVDRRTAGRATIIHSTRHFCLSFSDHQKLCATPRCRKEQNGIKCCFIWHVDACGRTGTHRVRHRINERGAGAQLNR